MPTPPWRYDSKQDVHNGKPIHYNTMTLEQIKRLCVDKIADVDAALFLWSVPALLKEAIEVGEAWGFKYKTKGFCWVKLNKVANTPFFGQGYYTRSNSEDCLLFLRGRMKRISAKVRQVVIERISRNSEKPSVVHERIVELFGDVPRLEMFARTKVPGWHSWGNEVKNDTEIPYGDQGQKDSL